MENKVKSVGEEFIEWANKTYQLEAMIRYATPSIWKESWMPQDITNIFADKINTIIEKRILEMHLGK